MPESNPECHTTTRVRRTSDEQLLRDRREYVVRLITGCDTEQEGILVLSDSDKRHLYGSDLPLAEQGQE